MVHIFQWETMQFHVSSLLCHAILNFVFMSHQTLKAIYVMKFIYWSRKYINVFLSLSFAGADGKCPSGQLPSSMTSSVQVLWRKINALVESRIVNDFFTVFPLNYLLGEVPKQMLKIRILAWVGGEPSSSFVAFMAFSQILEGKFNFSSSDCLCYCLPGS